MFLKSPLDSVPSLIRPVPPLPRLLDRSNNLNVPSMTDPSTHPPATRQLVIVTFSVGRAHPSAYEVFRQIPSSAGEFTVQLEMRTLEQQSISIPSRLVSSVTLSMVRLFTPVARIAKCPPLSTEISRMRTRLQFFNPIALFPIPGGGIRSGCGSSSRLGSEVGSVVGSSVASSTGSVAGRRDRRVVDRTKPSPDCK